jgi:mercuric ion transport protein
MDNHDNKAVSPKPTEISINARIAGTIVVLLCCFVPVLVLIFGASGLSAFTPYLYLILLLSFAAIIVLAVVSHNRWKKALHIN